jgi:hypothetical protein
VQDSRVLVLLILLLSYSLIFALEIIIIPLQPSGVFDAIVAQCLERQ